MAAPSSQDPGVPGGCLSAPGGTQGIGLQRTKLQPRGEREISLLSPQEFSENSRRLPRKNCVQGTGQARCAEYFRRQGASDLGQHLARGAGRGGAM